MSSQNAVQTQQMLQAQSRETLRFYLHHLEQLDKLLEVIELLKVENKQLRHMVVKTSVNKILSKKNPAIHSKPRITCWTFKEEKQ